MERRVSFRSTLRIIMATPERATGPRGETPCDVGPEGIRGSHVECNNNSSLNEERRPSQDDSVVYTESKGKGRVKSRRRGDSFSLRNSGRSAAWQNAPTDTHSAQEQRMSERHSKRQSLSALEMSTTGRMSHAMGSAPNLHNVKHVHSASEGLQPWHSATDMSHRSPHMRKSVSQTSWNETDPRVVQSTGNVNQRPVEDTRPPSPPVPPVRDASSLKFMTVNQPGHEKLPSWPVTASAQTTSSARGFSNRTSSWSDSTQTSAEMPPKPRMAYQPVLNTHVEEKGAKKLLQENQTKMRNSDFHQAVVTKLEGSSSQPNVAEQPDLKHFYNSHPPYPHPQYDRDGRVREDKDYSVPSPPERDTPAREARYYTTASAIALMAKNKPYYRMDVAKETSAAAEPQKPEPQVPAAKPQPRIPATIRENEESKKGGELHEDVIEKINELPTDQTWMLRKLSQEFYGGEQSRYGMGVTSRIDQKPEESKVKGEEENKDDLMTWFDRRSRNQMSIRKAYGISDDGVQEKPPTHHTRAPSHDSTAATDKQPDGFFGKKNKEKKEKKKKKKQDKEEDRLKRASAEQLKTEVSPKTEEIQRKRTLSSGNLRPASSEERVPQAPVNFQTPQKRFSASSLDAPHLDWSGNNEIRRKKSLSLPRDAAREMKRAALLSDPGHRSSFMTDPESELSPPPLLDITASNYMSLSPQVDYSPPLHPWSPPATSPKHPLAIHSYEDGTRPDLLLEAKTPKKEEKGIDALPNSYEYSDSSEGNSPASPDRLHQASNGIEQPPTLPPRNYRRKSTSAPAKKSPPPLPQPQHARSQSDKSTPAPLKKSPQPLPQAQHTRSQSDGLPSESGSPSTPPEVPRSGDRNCGDSTPKADAYADQLRQQALRFGAQSNRLLLSSRFQKRPPLPTSQPPEDSPPPSEPKAASPESTLPSSVPSDAQPPQPIHRSSVVAKDLNYMGLGADTNLHPVSSSVTMDTPFISTASSVPVASPQMAVALEQQPDMPPPPLPPKMESHPLLGNTDANNVTPDSNPPSATRFIHVNSDPFLRRRNPRNSSSGSSRPQSSSDESTPRSSRSLSTSVLPEISQREVSTDPPPSETMVQTPAKVTLTHRNIRGMSAHPSPLAITTPPKEGPVAIEAKSHSNSPPSQPSPNCVVNHNDTVPQHAGRSRVAEIRENILRKSNENLSDKQTTPPPIKVDSPPQEKRKLSRQEKTSSPTPEPREEPSPPPPSPPAEEEKRDISHVSQKSFEEIAYDEQAAIVAKQLCDDERHLSELILPSADHKKTSDFIAGIFDTKVKNVGRRPSLLTRFNSEQWTPPPIIDNSDAPLHCLKAELICRLEKKMKILSEEKQSLNEEVTENKNLGQKVTLIVEEKCQSKQERNKYKLYVDELDQVTYLLLKLAGRLAKAENSLTMLPAQASEHERATLTAKRDELHAKHEDAKDIKEGIDRRSQQVAGFLSKYLTKEEFTDYEHFIKMKLQLTIELQEIGDRVKQSEEQLKALGQSMQGT